MTFLRNDKANVSEYNCLFQIGPSSHSTFSLKLVPITYDAQYQARTNALLGWRNWLQKRIAKKSIENSIEKKILTIMNANALGFVIRDQMEKSLVLQVSLDALT